MKRRLSLVLIGLLGLLGCGPSGLSTTYGPRPAQLLARDSDQQQTFSYTHYISLFMDHDGVKPRYERARERCLKDAVLQCRLISANLSVGGYEDPNEISASLEFALPHNQLAGFEAALLRPVAGETGAVEVRSRNTRAESVENEANDADRKVAQLSKYRDGLAAFAKRPKLSVDDYIKVQNELSKTEADLAAASAELRDVHDRIARERLSIALNERGSMSAPLGQAWRNAGAILIDNSASAIRFAIGSIPWLPIAALAILAIRFLWRIARRRGKVAESKTDNNGG